MIFILKEYMNFMNYNKKSMINFYVTTVLKQQAIVFLCGCAFNCTIGSIIVSNHQA